MKPWQSTKEEEAAIDNFLQSVPTEKMVLITYRELQVSLSLAHIDEHVIKMIAHDLGFKELK